MDCLGLPEGVENQARARKRKRPTQDRRGKPPMGRGDLLKLEMKGPSSLFSKREMGSLGEKERLMGGGGFRRCTNRLIGKRIFGGGKASLHFLN